MNFALLIIVTSSGLSALASVVAAILHFRESSSKNKTKAPQPTQTSSEKNKSYKITEINNGSTTYIIKDEQGELVKIYSTKDREGKKFSKMLTG